MARVGLGLVEVGTDVDVDVAKVSGSEAGRLLIEVVVERRVRSVEGWIRGRLAIVRLEVDIMGGVRGGW